MGELSYNSKEKLFYLRASCYTEKGLAQKLSWTYIGHDTYTSPAHTAARRFRVLGNAEAKREIDRVLLRVAELPPGFLLNKFPKNKAPMPFQFDAVRFALMRNRAYLALDPGLGKTVVAALIINHLTPAFRVIILVPPFLCENMRAHLDEWLLNPDVAVYRETPVDARVIIIPDSIFYKKRARDVIAGQARNPDKSLLIVDEAHRFKSPTAERTKSLLGRGGIMKLFSRAVFLSGTPMPNRPLELYPVLKRCAPETIDYMDRFSYGKYYCAGYLDHEAGGHWNFSGASNMGELSKRVSKFMLRMKKRDVLKDIPEKIEELIFISDDHLPARITELERKILATFSPDDLYGDIAANGHISTYRKELGILKTQYTIPVIENILENGDESILIFAIHKDVVGFLSRSLRHYDPIIIDGDVPAKDRPALVKEFQSNSARRVLIGNIEAAGTGFTMTKASRVIFVEYSWTPAANEQAADRTHRIGQAQTVTVQYIVFKNSLDRKVLEINMKKSKDIREFEK